MSVLRQLAMINAIAFKEQKGFRYSALITAPIIIILGILVHYLNLNNGISPIVIGILSMLILTVIHFSLNRMAKIASKKFSVEIKMKYKELRKQEFVLLGGLLLVSLVLIIIYRNVTI